MRRLVMLTAIMALAGAGTATAAPSSRTYDRTPIVVAGLAPDGWGNSTSKAEHALYNRYPGISGVACAGATMLGDTADSSWVNGLTRFWDKLACGGYTRSGKSFALIYDAKGQYSWIIYRLKGVTVSALQYG